MLTANSRALHRVDTALLDERLDDKRDADTLAWRDRVDSDMQFLDDTPVPTPAVRCAPRARRRNVLVRAWRAVVLWKLRHDLECLQAEREGYQAAGVPLGAQYLANCADQERDLRSRIAMLECGLP